ncbi:MAG: class I SAM-dependent methyltransferase [bacterium]|nr:class I SAM-dependent methyltransferase [bacterium]
MITRNFYKEIQDINELPEKGKVLDLGCGNGRFSLPFSEAGFTCVLIDNREDMLNRARFDVQKNAEYHLQDLNTFLQASTEQYEIIIANNVLPFLSKKDSDDALKYIYDHLKPNGIFIGVLFGDRDPWNRDGRNTEVFHSRAEALDVLSKYKILDFREIDALLGLLVGGVKQWHRFEFIAKKL